jgi:hypothetical protein
MAFQDPWFSEGKMSPLDWERRMYEQTKNPLHAWRALQICVALMRGGSYGCDSLPEWMLDYFKTATSGIQEMFGDALDGNDQAITQKLADALGFKRVGQGVRGTAFSNYSLEHRDLMIATGVGREIRLNPTQSIETIIAEFAEREQMSSEMVWRAWDHWREFVEARHAAKSRTVTTSPKS